MTGATLQRTGWASVGLLAALAGPLAAQATIRGFVKAEQGGPLAGADVLVKGTELKSQTGPDGRFLIGGIKPGTYVVAVRAVGFQPVEADAKLSGHDTVDVTFELKRSVQVLESLKVEAAAPKPVSAKMMEFEDRRKEGLGKFLTRDMLEAREHSPLTEVLRMVPGLKMVRRPAECGDGYAAASGRSGVMRREPWMQCGGPYQMAAACYLSIYVDGARVWTWGQEDIPDLDKIMSTVTLEGIEIYRGPSETPIKYQVTGSACGVLLLWTR